MLTAMMSCFCDPHPHLAFLVSCPVLVPCPVSSPISSQQNYTHTHTHTHIAYAIMLHLASYRYLTFQHPTTHAYATRLLICSGPYRFGSLDVARVAPMDLYNL